MRNKYVLVIDRLVSVASQIVAFSTRQYLTDMEDGILIRYYDDLLEDFRKSYAKAKNKHKKKDIHKMRVSIKKLRAIWKLIKSLTHEYFSDKDLKIIVRPLFKKAGAYRESQLNLDLFKKLGYGSCKGYVQHLKNAKKKHKKVLLEELKNFDIEISIKMFMVIRQRTSQITADELSRGVHENIKLAKKNVEELALTLPNTENLHRIRSNFRVIREMMDLIKVLKIADGSQPLKKVKRLYEDLGDWHDVDILIQSFEEYGGCKKCYKRLYSENTKTEKKLERIVAKWLSRHS